MRNKIFLAIAIFSSMLLSGFLVIQGILDRIGLEEKEAQKTMLLNLLGTSSEEYRPGTSGQEFSLPKASMLSSIAAGDKPAAALEMCQWVKQYAKSPEFAQIYAQRRNALKPPPGNDEPKPDEETIKMSKESLKYMEEQLAQLKSIKGTPIQTIKSLEDQVAQGKQQLESWEDPNYKITQWERQYPSEVKQLVKRRLQEFLDLGATVDFKAALRSEPGSKVKTFANKDYESKSSQWKSIYRAGPEVYAAVSGFVKDWLRQDFGVTASPPVKTKG